MFLFPPRLSIFAGLLIKSRMFTVGIFSTHLPYIAFVLFYGFFFIAGIEKASEGDLGEGQQIIPDIISVSADTFTDVDDYDPFDFTCSAGTAEFQQLILYGEKLYLLYCNNSSITIAGFCFSWFSRPPPVA